MLNSGILPRKQNSKLIIFVTLCLSPLIIFILTSLLNHRETILNHRETLPPSVIQPYANRRSQSHSSNVLAPYVIYSFTTIPQRIPLINQTLQTLLYQSYPINEIVISIPISSRRFKDQVYDIPSYLYSFSKRISILRTEDYGPGTKFIAIINREKLLKRESHIIIVDDDVLYPKNHAESLMKATQLQPHSALGLRGLCIDKDNNWRGKQLAKKCIYASLQTQHVMVDILTANHGILVKPSFFNILSVNITNNSPEAAYYMDDIWLNGILGKNGISRMVIPNSHDPRHRENVQMKSPNLSTDTPHLRGELNTELLHYFGNYWLHCTIDENEVNINVDDRIVCCGESDGG